MTEMRYVEGLYGLWDGMLQANPGLVIDNCALGGTRLDLETASRSVMLWRSDSVVPPLWNRRDYNVNAIQNQVMNFALNRYVPLTQSGSMGTSPYLIRSAFNGGLSFGEDTRPADYPRSQLAEGIAECKRLRKYLPGDFYPLHMPSESPEQWCAYQYHRPEEGDGCVFVFRRHESSYRSIDLKLRGIDPAAVYLLYEYRGYQPEPARKLMGAELLVYVPEVDEKPGSLLLEYAKMP
jgi:alpha-galactosidase